MASAQQIAAKLWSGLGGDPHALDRLRLSGPTHVLPSIYPVTAAATATVAVASLAAAELWEVRGGPTAQVAVDSRHAALAFRSERLTQVVGQPKRDVWGSVSGDYATNDGWIRLHAVFPAHRRTALQVLGLSDTDAESDKIRAAVARWSADALEDAVYREGGCAGRLRSLEQWCVHPQAAAVGLLPLVGLTPIGATDGSGPPPHELDRPLAGMRVLDLTRVIAGPVAGRFLAAHGAEVLRIDPPGSDDHPEVVTDTTVGKRSAVLDLHDDDDRARFESLVRKADAVLCAYRPGALDDLGYDPASLAGLRPGLVVGTLSAYGGIGPWGAHRGFDSLVQMTTGLAEEARRAAGAKAPVHLPAQALDHATGYLMAAGVMQGLTRRTAASRGGGWLAQTCLAGTSKWLEGLGRGGSVDVADPEDVLPDDLAVDFHGPMGHTRHIACPGAIVGATPRWTTGPVALGHHPPEIG